MAWGGFFFRRTEGEARDYGIVDDPAMEDALGERRDSIGVRSQPFGHAEVTVSDAETGDVVASARTAERNFVRIGGLQPDTAYTYQVLVDGEPFGQDPCRAWEDSGDSTDLTPTDRVYDTTFRTFPSPDRSAPLRFAVLGDFGVGILNADDNGRRQRHLAGVLERAVDHAGVRLIVTTGDNVYEGEEDSVAGSGKHDADWYFSFFEPYRFVINRVPVYPGVGNHDDSDTEFSEDREQLEDNMYTEIRFADGVADDRVSIDPGLFYRFSYGSDIQFIAIDSTGAEPLAEEHYVDHPRHRAFVEQALLDSPGRWQVPFMHHPPYCAGPKHGNSDHLIESVVPLFQKAGVRLVLAGHEHNFQHNRVGDIDYLVSGAGGKLREGVPEMADEAGTVSWADEPHLLIVDIDGDELTVHPVTDVGRDGTFQYLQRRERDDVTTRDPIVIRRA